VVLLSLGLLIGCGQDRVHEGDHAAIYDRVFGALPPADIEVTNAVLYEYRWRLGTVTTDDWEIEIVAPRSWIDGKIKELDLGPLADGDSWVEGNISDRKSRPYRSWYAPQPLDSYEILYLTPTSIPYVHMLVEKQSQSDGRYRLYMSKH
jgi:hypothetical protein